ncbi:MAG TPA: response regulator [Anaerolineaceae bacterium]|nr:response regulator [Anaerolineaceae bacterium]
MAGSEQIRVLIVDDIAETRENIRKLLQFEGDVEVVGAARTGKEAIELAMETKPDVVLMDINMPDMDGIAATEAIRKKVPFSQIVILSVQGDPNYMRRAMLAGARDFLTKPPMVDELSAAIHRAGAMAREEKTKVLQSAPAGGGDGTQAAPGGAHSRGKIIVVYSPKGGTGSTTIATNLAISLHNDETRVALVDGNLQFGDVAVFLNEQGKNSVIDLTSRADELDPDIIEEVMVNHTGSGLQILAAPSKPEMADKVASDQFGKVLQYLRTIYSYIVVDTSSYLTEVVLSAMEVADILVLLTTQDIPAIKNAKAFLTLADGFKFSRQRIVFIMNRFDKRISIAPEKVGESLRQEIAAIIPLDEKIVVNAVNRGVPFMLDNKSQPIGRSLLALAELIRERIAKIESTPEPDRVGKR